MGQAAFVETGVRDVGRAFEPLAETADISAFFDVSLDLLIIRDLEGRVVKASRSWQVSMGYAPEELEGLPLLRLLHPEDAAKTRESVVEVEQRRAGDPVRGFINRYRHRDGHYRVLEWRAQRFGDRIYAVARDVTDRVAAEQANVEAIAAAEAASRAKSDFLANMSHEIRTPLNGVIGIVDALSRTALTPEQAEMVELIRMSGGSLERLVSEILDMSKIEAGRLELEIRPFDLEATLRAGIEVMRPRAEAKGLAVEVIGAADVGGLFLGDSVRLRQVLTNLLSNAVKFTDRGAIRVRVALDEIDGDSTRLSLAVEDTGVGFDAEQTARLFERFTQADSTITRRFGGTGLGLPICHALVTMMGGEITASSTPGVGSVFAISLPLERCAAGLSGPSVAASLDGAVATETGRPLRVLLAEDHPTNQRVVELILSTQNAELVTVEDGAQALSAFETGMFDLVLMDMQMPVMDGLSATRAIRALEAGEGRRPTPIVMLSANALLEHRRAAEDAGADLHVAKPITAASLLAGMRTALDAAASVAD